MITPEEVYPIGRIGKTHGVKGEVSFQFTDDVFDRADADYLILEVDGILVPFFMEEYRFRNDTVALVKFCDIDSQQRAAELTGCNVYLPRTLVGEDEGEVSFSVFIGFSLTEATTGTAIGRIAAIDDSTANTLFELEDGKLIPASTELISHIDMQKREIEIDIPKGLLDI